MYRSLRFLNLAACKIVHMVQKGEREARQQGKARALARSVADHKEIVDFAQRVKKGQMIAGSR